MAGEDPNNKAPATKHISVADDGGMILVLRRDGNDTRIRAPSTVLSYSSPVFKALLAPGRFAEGNGARSAHDPKEISFEEDDCTVMVDLCALLHQDRKSDLAELRPETPGCPRGLHSRRLLELSILIDKYDCAAPVRFTAEALFSRFSVTALLDAPTLCNLVAATYILRFRHYFQSFTRDLILTSTNPFGLQLDQRHGKLLGLSTLYALDSQRSKARDCLTEEFLDIMSKDCSSLSHPYTTCPKLYAHEAIPRYAHYLTERAVWPSRYNHHSLKHLLEMLSDVMYGPDEYVYSSKCGFKYDYDIEPSQFKALKNNVEEAKGLCLSCVLEENIGECGHRED